MENVTDTINEIVGKRTHYGRRDEIVPNHDFTFLMWSNAQKKWIVNVYKTDVFENYTQDKIANLDANEIVVPFKADVVEGVIDQLNDLPLYRNSFEAGIRG